MPVVGGLDEMAAFLVETMRREFVLVEDSDAWRRALADRQEEALVEMGKRLFGDDDES